jgi:hypothetical protein
MSIINLNGICHLFQNKDEWEHMRTGKYYSGIAIEGINSCQWFALLLQ